jgi:hypothetical protein
MCKFCKEYDTINDGDAEMFLDEKTLTIHDIVEGQWTSCRFDITHCPMCGREL